MATCWSLWQKMPPRYQLTTRSFEEIVDPNLTLDSRASSPATPRSPRSPRHRADVRSTMSSPRQHIAGSCPSGDGKTAHPESNKRFHFPNRKSSYLDHIKTQQRVNSARVKLAADPTSFSRPPKQRARTAPLVSPRPCEDEKHTNSVGRPQSQVVTINEKVDIPESNKRSKTEACLKTTSDPVVSTDHALHMARETSTPRKFIVRDTDEGTLYIDNGKVTFFRKTRHDVSQFMKGSQSRSDGSFLSRIRREYLNKPKYLAAANKTHGRTITSEEQLIQRERVNYNKKVEHILDYYSYDDEDKISMEDLSRYTASKSQKYGPNKVSHSRAMSPRVGRLYFEQSPRNVQPVSPTFETVEDPNVYMKVNKKSKLHDRQFYLKTPGFKGIKGFPVSEFDNCKCGMCRIEMQISLLTQLGVPLPFQLANFPVSNTTEPGDNCSSDTQKANKVENLENEGVVKPSAEQQDNATSEQLGPKLEQTLTITLPEMTNERETTELSTRGSERDTSRTKSDELSARESEKDALKNQ